MSAQDLSFQELSEVTHIFADGGTLPVWFAEHPIGRVFRPELLRLRGIIARAPSDTSEIGRLTLQVDASDAAHDEALRFAIGVLSNAQNNHPSANVRATAEDLLDLLFPDGVSLAQKSHEEEVTAGMARGSLRTPAVRAKLARFFIPTETGPAIDLDRFMEDELDTRLVGLLNLMSQRNTLPLPAGTPPMIELLAAKKQLIALVAQIFSAFKAVDDTLSARDRTNLKSFRDDWNRAVRRATARLHPTATPAPTPRAETTPRSETRTGVEPPVPAPTAATPPVAPAPLVVAPITPRLALPLKPVTP